MFSRFLRFPVFAACILLFTLPVRAEKVWGGAVGADWNTGGNWIGGLKPVAGDDVLITNAANGVLLSSSTPALKSLTLSNNALTCEKWTTTINAVAVTVQSNGLVTAHRMAADGVASNRVHIICANLRVEPGGAIDVKGKGFAPWDGPGSGHTHNSSIHNGGSYGGLGGWGYSGGGAEFEGHTYGSAARPLWLGSGGGSRDRTEGAYADFRGEYAGWGGGAIRVVASGTVTINGTIGADGGDARDPGPHEYVAGGSGGSIYITCGTLGGNGGVIRALGGNALHLGNTGGGGGGGRIAVDYANLAAQRKLSFSAGPAPVDWGCDEEIERWPWAARMGTLWLPDVNLLTSPVTDQLFSNCCLVIDGVSALEMDSLTVSNASFTFADPGFELRVRGDLVIGSGGELGIGGYYDKGSNFLLAVGGNLTLTNGGKLHVFAGETNGVPGDVATLVMVTNDIVVGPTSWIVPYCGMTNGSTVRFEAENLAIASGGGIMARGRGYRSRWGHGAAGSASYASGGSHGGVGGLGAATQYKGAVYDSVHAPSQPGSSSGTYGSDTHMYHASAGGGVVRMEVRGAVTVDGTIDADGADRLPDTYAACGSGGSIHIRCNTFGGAGGLIRADGGSTFGDNNSGPGGGGRIAIDYNSVVGAPTVAFSVAGGSNGWATATGREDLAVYHLPQAGTLSLPDTALLTDTLTDALFPGGVRLYFAEVSSWTPPRLTVSNCTVNFAQDQFELSVTGDVRVESGGVLGIGDDDDGSNYVLNCANLVVTNGGMFEPYAGRTNDSSQAYGTLVNVSGDIVVGPASWIRPRAQKYNGATVQFTAENVTIADGGGFNANGRGYYSWYGPGRGAARSDKGAGGGYGGRGGMGENSVSDPGEPYGSTNAPVEPGSAGGTHGGGYQDRGAIGGGSVRIEAANRLTLYGTITADGGDAWVAPWCGGASGGSIYLFCRELRDAATARLSAEGGDSSSSDSGPGGGGRIAVWEGFMDAQRTAILGGATLDGVLLTNDAAYGFKGEVSVATGTGHVHATTPATPGTVRFLKTSPPPGSLIMVTW